ncbi:hypothetical protein [Verrucomicrobium spinosum]|uniref:hypothetical protein n=1 Tax=Verrucomicrobium spinosum TaxID=2736 RepID=UPI0001746400|nr:hypothetical protein [Verrucomicrobium spinosum]
MKKLPRPVFVLVLVFATLLGSFVSGAGAVETAKWNWSPEIPAAYTAKSSARAHRTVAAIEAYFKENQGAPDIQKMIAHFGTPDGVSSQFMNSLTKGTAETSKSAYTLRFVLDDGGEMHLWDGKGDGTRPGLVIRYEEGGKGHLLWK